MTEQAPRLLFGVEFRRSKKTYERFVHSTVTINNYPGATFELTPEGVRLRASYDLEEFYDWSRIKKIFFCKEDMEGKAKG